MSKAQVWVEIPDGWELADQEMRIPREGEWYLVPDATEPVRVLVRPTGPRVVVRRSWQWPEWLTARCVFQTESGIWLATGRIPVLSGNGGYWRWDGGHADLALTTFTQPPCDDWKHSLRINPNWKDK